MEIKLEIEDTRGLTKDDRETVEIKNAEKITARMKKNIVKRFPSMYMAAASMKFIPVREDIEFETDGCSIFYSPHRTIKAFRSKRMKDLEYRYMHIMAHGLLGHFSMADEYECNPLMHAVMDYKVYMFLLTLGMSNAEPLWMGFGSSDKSLKKIYKYVSEDIHQKRNMLESQKIIGQDDYKIWTRGRKYHMYFKADEEGGEAASAADKWNKLRSSMLRKGGKGSGDLISKMKEQGNDSKGYGSESLSEEEMVRAKEFAQVEYKNVLRKFFKLRESSKENIEAIDKALYAWGFDQYGDVAFVEPEAESMNPQIETIVLAIDTSGSCEGELIEQFMAESRELFRSISKVGFREFVVLQCDASIQKADTYKSPLQFPKMSDFNVGQKMFGFGGTDFNPVFDYVDELINGGHEVDCLLYLSDGMGNFPEAEPEGYKTFFVMPYEEPDNNNILFGDIVPDWVEKIYLKNIVEEDD